MNATQKARLRLHDLEVVTEDFLRLAVTLPQTTEVRLLIIKARRALGRKEAD